MEGMRERAAGRIAAAAMQKRGNRFKSVFHYVLVCCYTKTTLCGAAAQKKPLHGKGRMECAAGCRRQFPPVVSGNAAFSEDAKVNLVQSNNSQELRNPHWVKNESAKFLQGKNPRHFLIFLQPYLSFLLSLEAFFAPLSSLLSQKIEFVGGEATVHWEDASVALWTFSPLVRYGAKARGGGSLKQSRHAPKKTWQKHVLRKCLLRTLVARKQPSGICTTKPQSFIFQSFLSLAHCYD